MKVLFTAQNFHMGGVQKALINTLKVMEKENCHEIDLFSFAGGVMEKDIPQCVNVSYGGRALRVVSTPFKDVLKSKSLPDILTRAVLMVYVRLVGSEEFYRRMLKKYKRDVKYDVSISYFTDGAETYFNRGTNTFVTEYTNAEKKLAWIHNDPIDAGFDKEYFRRIYKDFDYLICVSSAVKDKFDVFLPEYKERTRVYYNPFPEDEIRSMAEEFVPFEKSEVDIVTVGRVDNHQKRIDAIIKLVKRLKDDSLENFKWHIVGDGPDMAANKALAKALGVEELVVFEGQTTNPYPYIKCSDVFALYSEFEGYPMVIGETLALDVPVLVREYAAAREQIPRDKGFVAESDEEFYEKIKAFIKENKLF